MEIGTTLDVKNRKEWRAWLSKHYKKEKEIWLVYYKKHSGKPRIPYNDAVEEALCFGWIDSIAKKLDDDSFVQRFSPRRKGSVLSELNKERIRMMIAQKKMKPYGLKAVEHAFDTNETQFIIPKDILKALQKDKKTWEHFEKFPSPYKRIRVAWIDSARKRPKMFKQRLNYFLKKTSQNKKFGMMQ